MNLKKIAIIASLLFLLSSIPSTSPARSAEVKARPNIVLLFVDDYGWGEWHYKTSSFATPNIDHLAKQGVSLDNAYAASPTCSPSRASVITGRHPARLRLVRHIENTGPTDEEFALRGGDPARMPSRNWLPLEEMTIAEALSPLGYHSAFVGKWHLGHEPYFPIHNGFDVQFGVSTAGHPKSYIAPFFSEASPGYLDVPEGKYLTDQVTDDAVAYIENQKGDDPFLLTVFYYSAHDPFLAKQEMLDRLKKENPGKQVSPLSGMIASVDDSVGRIVSAIEKKGAAPNTIFCLLGDQGGKRPMPPMRGTKKGGQALYEGGARVPFIVAGPGIVQSKRSKQLASTNDVLPTLLELAGGQPADYPELDGRSLADVLRGGPADPSRKIFLYRSYEDQYAAVRSGQWKLIAYRRGRCELYNVENDISETSDLAAEKPEVVEQLKSALKAWEKEMGVPGELVK